VRTRARVRNWLIWVLAGIGAGFFGTAAAADDAGKIDAYVTPYYNSAGPAIHVGKYSSGLASPVPGTFVRTIFQMKRQWADLNFVELYVGAIQLYDRGYRNEATYWFYTAQYRGKQFAALLEQSKMGGMGSPAFELYHAQDAFFQLVGPNINGWAFGNIADAVKIMHRVAKENQTVADLQTVYPGVAFIHRSQWQQKNAGINSGLAQLAQMLPREKTQLAQERAQNGTQARFASLNSRPFPGGL
jgi:hypothetical protein